MKLCDDRSCLKTMKAYDIFDERDEMFLIEVNPDNICDNCKYEVEYAIKVDLVNGEYIANKFLYNKK